MTEQETEEAAIEFARKNKERIARDLTDIQKYPPDTEPLSVFMAGSPGAGKTEFSTALVRALEDDGIRHVLLIDTDDYRNVLPGYTGANSYLFQAGVSIIADKVHDLALSHNQSFIFDGTLWKYERAVKNIKRSLDKHRSVLVVYVYQRPEIAWKFTQARELAEGRHVPRRAFIDQFLGARATVERIVEDFGSAVAVTLVKKDFTKHSVESITMMDRGHPIDAVIHERYTVDSLEKIL